MSARPARLALLLACLAAPAARSELHKWTDPDGTTHISDRRQAQTLREWTDDEGVTHLTRAPSDKALARARKEQVAPRATGVRSSVRDTRAYDDFITRAAARYSIPHALVRAVIVAESNFNPRAVSRTGAQGLMQLMPGTARDMFVSDPWNPEQNIEGGTRYLRILANGFQGDLVKTIAGYNAGPEAVRRAGGVPPFAETKGYVKRVLKLYSIYSGGAR